MLEEQIKERLEQLLTQEQADELFKLINEYADERFQDGRDYEWSVGNDGPVW